MQNFSCQPVVIGLDSVAGIVEVAASFVVSAIQ